MNFILFGESKEQVNDFLKSWQDTTRLIEVYNSSSSNEAEVNIARLGTFHAAYDYNAIEKAMTELISRLEAEKKKEFEFEFDAAIFLFSIFNTRQEFVKNAMTIFKEKLGMEFEENQKIICITQASDMDPKKIPEKQEKFKQISNVVVLWDSANPLDGQFDNLRSAIRKVSKKVKMTKLPEITEIPKLMSKPQMNKNEEVKSDKKKPDRIIVNIKIVNREEDSWPGIFNIIPGCFIPYIIRPCTSAECRRFKEQGYALDGVSSSGNLSIKSRQISETPISCVGGESRGYDAMIEGDKLIVRTEIGYRCAQFGNYEVTFEGTIEIE